MMGVELELYPKRIIVRIAHTSPASHHTGASGYGPGLVQRETAWGLGRRG